METARAWLELRPLDAKEVEGFEVNDVQDTTAVHQDLREHGADDDRVDDKREDAGSDHPVGVVIAVEGDGGVRPVEVLGYRHPCRKDLAALPLALPRGELCRGSTVDQVAVVDGREAFIFNVSLLIFTLVFPLVVLLQSQAVEVLF